MPASQDSPTVRYLRIGSFAAPVRFDGCEDLIDAIRSIFPSWDISEVPADGGHGPVIRFQKRNDRFLWYSRRYPSPDKWTKRERFLRVKDTAADFHYVFFEWFTDENPDLFCMHCAAVEMSGKLVVFPSVKYAGKSTLMMEMARRGHRVFCDDVLVFDPERLVGVSLGIMPRPRLPLPESLTPEQRRFVGDHSGLIGRNSVYLDLSEPVLADYGATAPIGAVVLLDRQKTQVEAGLHPAGPAEVLARMIAQNAPLQLSPTRIFDKLHEVVTSADLHRLHYENLAEAADLLEQAFAS